MFRVLLLLALLISAMNVMATSVTAATSARATLFESNLKKSYGEQNLFLAKGGKPAGLTPKFKSAAKPKGLAPKAKAPVANKNAPAPRSASGRALPQRAHGVRFPNQTQQFQKSPAVSDAARRLQSSIKPQAKVLAKTAAPHLKKKVDVRLSLRASQYILRSHKNTTFPNKTQSIQYHWKKHGQGKSLLQYTKDARKLWRTGKNIGTSVKLGDGSPGVKIRAKNGNFGIFTESGTIVSFGYK